MATSRFEDLPKTIGKLNGRIRTGITQATRKAAGKAHVTAVRATRVDTGFARSNWVVTIGNPFLGEIPPYAPGMKLGFKERANASAAITQGRNVIKTWKVNAPSIFIANNVDYIETLNDGRARTAPDMMKEKAVQAGILAAKAGLRGALEGRKPKPEVT